MTITYQTILSFLSRSVLSIDFLLKIADEVGYSLKNAITRQLPMGASHCPWGKFTD